jgi:hypothetical protein
MYNPCPVRSESLQQVTSGTSEAGEVLCEPVTVTKVTPLTFGPAGPARQAL